MLLVAVALAHVPHDNVWILAAPRDLDPSVPWLAVYDSAHVVNLLRSDDGGTTWSMIAGDPVMDELLAGGMLDDGTAVLLAADRWWWSIDGGESWTEEALPGAVETVWAADVLWLAGDDGVFRVEPGGASTHELSGVAVHRLGPGPVAVTDSDHVYRRGSTGTWSDQGSPGSGLTAAAWGGGRLYAGNDAGSVWYRSGSTWRACAALPAAVLASGYPDIRHLSAESYGVVVAPAWRAPYEGNPSCTGWRDRSGPADSAFGESGGPESVDEAFTALFTTSGGAWVVTGWDGFWSTPDRGATWEDAPLIPVDYTRSIAFSPDFATDGTLWYGPYASGVALTRDAGATLEAPSHGLARANVQRVYAATGAGTGGTVYAVVNYDPFVSYDGGESWTEFGTSLADFAAMRVWENPDHVWAMNVGSAGRVWETTDGGSTWTELTDLRATLAGARAIGAVDWTDADGIDLLCVMGQDPVTVACSEDGGATWDAWYTSTTVEADDMVAWPDPVAPRLLFLDDDGLHWTEDGGLSWTTDAPLGDDALVALAVAPDGALFAASASGWLLRSDDGGDTWVDLALRSTGHVYQIAPRPDYADHDDVLLATHDGLYALRDASGAAPTLERWADLRRVDDRAEYWTCDGCGASVSDATAGMDSLTPLSSGAEVRLWLRGDTVRVWGTSDGTGGATLAVDGVAVASFGSAVASAVDVLAEVGGLGDTVHEVVLTGSGSGGLYLDAVEAETAWDPLDLGATVDADGDGQPSLADGGTDCDDGDPSVYLGAPETWYDGVDQNCSGGSDYDRDADGYDASLYGGTDCRDNLATVNPGRTESLATPYDDNCDHSLTT